MKDIYQSKLNRIRELKQARDKEGLIDTAIQLSKQINQRFYRLEKQGVGLNESAYRYAQMETGKSKPRYSTSRSVLEDVSTEELYEHLLNLNQKLVSQTSTVSGVKNLVDRRIEASASSLEERIGQKIDREKYKEFLEKGGGELLNHLNLESTQIIEDWVTFGQLGNVSVKEFMKAFTSFNEKERIDYGKVTRDLKRLTRYKKKQKSKNRRSRRKRRNARR